MIENFFHVKYNIVEKVWLVILMENSCLNFSLNCKNASLCRVQKNADIKANILSRVFLTFLYFNHSKYFPLYFTQDGILFIKPRKLFTFFSTFQLLDIFIDSFTFIFFYAAVDKCFNNFFKMLKLVFLINPSRNFFH